MSIRAKYRAKYKAIPYGIHSSNQIVPPEKALSGEEYRCPECRKKLVLRESRLKNPFFSHSRRGTCKINDSSVALAKHVLQLILDQCLQGSCPHPVEILTFCGSRYDLPFDEITQVKMNHKVRLYEKRSLLSHFSLLDHYGQSILNIEIRDKARKRHIKSPSWLELSAEEVLSNPYLWSSLNPHNDTLPFFLQPVQLKLNL